MRIIAALLATCAAYRLDNLGLEGLGAEAGNGTNITDIALSLSSPFEEWAARQATPDCPARVIRSTCSDDEFRGLVVFFHGFSACSLQVESVSEMLAGNCLDVLAPTMPGHGTSFTWCGEGGATCDVQCYDGNGWTMEGVPTTKDPYDTWAREAHFAVWREFNYRAAVVGKSRSDLDVSLLGLSFGAPVALKLALIGGSFYSRQLHVNPYWALGDETIDHATVECEMDSGRTDAECEVEATREWMAATVGDSSYVSRYLGSDTDEVVQSLFNNIAKLSDAQGADYTGPPAEPPEDGSLAHVMETPHDWCNNACHERANSGFGKMKNKHLFATHAFSMHTMVDLHQPNAWHRGVSPMQIITTERDGKTRNGLAYDVARHLNSLEPGAVSYCMHKFQQGVDRTESNWYFSNENSVPHAAFDGQILGRWWEAPLAENVRRYILGLDVSISLPATSGEADRAQCESISLEDGSEADVAAFVTIGIASTEPSMLRPGVGFTVLGLWR